MKFISLVIFSLLFSLLCSPQAYATEDLSQKSLRNFVQGFYDWYAPKALRDNSGLAWDVAVKEKGCYFSKELALQLQEDSNAQAKAQGDIVGLDFDPFLNSQDPEGHYKVGLITQKSGGYWVDIDGDSSGNKAENVIVVAELAYKNGQWKFVNFHYPNGYNLLAVLKALRENRKKPSVPGRT
jgi:hypothetical protein